LLNPRTTLEDTIMRIQLIIAAAFTLASSALAGCAASADPSSSEDLGEGSAAIVVRESADKADLGATGRIEKSMVDSEIRDTATRARTMNQRDLDLAAETSDFQPESHAVTAPSRFLGRTPRVDLHVDQPSIPKSDDGISLGSDKPESDQATGLD
jgi:hypothetical protein